MPNLDPLCVSIGCSLEPHPARRRSRPHHRALAPPHRHLTPATYYGCRTRSRRRHARSRSRRARSCRRRAKDPVAAPRHLPAAVRDPSIAVPPPRTTGPAHTSSPLSSTWSVNAVHRVAWISIQPAARCVPPPVAATTKTTSSPWYPPSRMVLPARHPQLRRPHSLHIAAPAGAAESLLLRRLRVPPVDVLLFSPPAPVGFCRPPFSAVIGCTVATNIARSDDEDAPPRAVDTTPPASPLQPRPPSAAVYPAITATTHRAVQPCLHAQSLVRLLDSRGKGK